MKLFFILLSLSFNTHAQKNMGLKEILPLAVENSPFLKAQRLEVMAREHLVEHAGTWHNPEFSIETENKEQPTHNTTKGTKYSIAMPLFVPGRISAQQGIAESELAIEKTNQSNLQLQTRVTVSQLFYEYAADIEKARHAEERFKRFQSISQYLKSRTFASPRKKTESSIVSSKILILQKELEKAKSAVDITWNKLNVYLNLPEKIGAKVFWLKTPINISEKIILEKAEKNNPELNLLAQETEKNKQALRLSRKEMWPDFKLLGSISDLSGYDPEKVYTLGIAFPIPVFNMNISASRAQSYRLDAAQTKLTAYRRNLQGIVNSAFLRHQTNQRSISQLQISKVAELEKDFAESDLGFRKGLVDLVTYLEADTQHADAITAIYDTQVEYIESMGELSILSGDFLIPTEL